MGNLTWEHSHKTMISNKTITFSAAGLAYANGLAIQSKLQARVESQDIFSDMADWTVGAVGDAGSWFEGAGNDIADWTEGAVQDVGSWTVNAFSDVGDAFVDAANWTGGAFTDAYDWMKDGDNWEAMGKTMVGATVTGFSGDWEGGWDLFTNSKMYYVILMTISRQLRRNKRNMRK